MSREPLVSVCMPCRNAERYVGEAVDSVLNQTYKKIELIIINDNSTDKSLQILKKLKDKRIKIITKKCGSAGAARNRAFEKSTGEYIKFLDADDLISSKMIEKQVNKIKRDYNAIAMSGWGRFYNNDIKTFSFYPQKVWKDMKSIDWLKEALFDAKPMMQSGMFLIPKRLIKKTGKWLEEPNPYDDFEYFCRLFCLAKRIKFVEKEMLYYRSGNKESLSQKKGYSEMEAACKAMLQGTNWILQKTKDKKARQACANCCKQMIYAIYPQFQNLQKALAERIKECGGSTIKAEGGIRFKIFRSIIGWKLSKRLQLLCKKNEK